MFASKILQTYIRAEKIEDFSQIANINILRQRNNFRPGNLRYLRYVQVSAFTMYEMWLQRSEKMLSLPLQSHQHIVYLFAIFLPFLCYFKLFHIY